MKVVKIGIITFQRADNYGALLQCYALYKYVKGINSDTEVIDYRNPVIADRYKKYKTFIRMHGGVSPRDKQEDGRAEHNQSVVQGVMYDFI